MGRLLASLHPSLCVSLTRVSRSCSFLMQSFQVYEKILRFQCLLISDAFDVDSGEPKSWYSVPGHASDAFEKVRLGRY